MHKIRTIIIAIIIYTAITAPQTLASNNQPYNTAIIIDNEIVTHLDVIQRLDIALVTSGLKATERNKRLLLPQIVQILIDETLYQQEAERLDIKISEQELQNAIRSIEQKNGLPPNSFNMFLQDNQLSKSSFLEQLESQIAWKKL